MNKRSRCIDEETFKLIVSTLRTGFTDNDGVVRAPNERIATILTIEYNLGIRIGDVLELRMANLIKDGNRYCFDITEQKTGKHRGYTIPFDVYLFIQGYANSHNISPNQKLFPISERNVSKLLKIACEYLGLEGIGTHSFRKAFATNAYINSEYNIEMVRNLLQHSSIDTTQRYIGIGTKEMEEVIVKSVCLG